MIQAASWYCAQHCGTVVPGGVGSWQQPSPAPAATAEVMALIGRPVKYFSKMTAESRHCICAASLALRAAKWREKGAPEIGLLAAGYEGCMQADEAYFRDYVASGRTLGRGNLFIYTLPTSALGVVSIALELTGPALHLYADERPLASLARHARDMIADQEADGMLALWGNHQAAVCLAVGAGDDAGSFAGLASEPQRGPLELAQRLQGMIPQT